MAQLCRPTLSAALLLAGLPILTGCSSMGVSNPFASSTSAPPPSASGQPVIPPSVRAEDMVGRWGLASYYIGPGADPAGADDREVVNFDGRVMILKWIDPEVAGRYGTMVLVRCGAEGTATARTARVKKKPAATLQ